MICIVDSKEKKKSNEIYIQWKENTMIFSVIFIFEGFVEMELFPIFNSYYYSLKCTM